MPAPSRPNFVRRLLSFSRQLSSRPSRRGRMCKKTVTTTRWAARKRRRAWRGRRRSAAGVRSAEYRALTHRAGAAGFWAMSGAARRNCQRKNAAEARRTFPEGSRTIYFRSLGSTQGGQRSLGSSPPKSWIVPVRLANSKRELCAVHSTTTIVAGFLSASITSPQLVPASGAAFKPFPTSAAPHSTLQPWCARRGTGAR